MKEHIISEQESNLTRFYFVLLLPYRIHLFTWRCKSFFFFFFKSLCQKENSKLKEVMKVASRLPEPGHFGARISFWIFGHSAGKNPPCSTAPLIRPQQISQLTSGDNDQRSHLIRANREPSSSPTEFTVHPPFVLDPKACFSEVAKFSCKPHECTEQESRRLV